MNFFFCINNSLMGMWRYPLYWWKKSVKGTDIEFLRPEDTVVVTDLTRLSRFTKDLIEITELISQTGAHLKSLKQSWLDTTITRGKMLFTIFAGIAHWCYGSALKFDVFFRY
jgi:hypothetical protein